ncbi:MAG: 50S ribosomal protein L10 [Clostridia bacterium]|nr:50S ribosomal protein L10 [Clostridia bacterium]
MSKNRDLKVEKVAEIVEKLRNAESVTVVSYTGLTVEQDTNLRRQCRENDVDYCVLKNRLVKLALQQVGIEGLDDLLNGPNAFVFSKKDPVSGPKAVAQFIEKNKLEALKITGGIMDGKAADTKTMEALSKMPSRDELLATLVGCLVSPVSSLVAVLGEIAEKKEAA